MIRLFDFIDNIRLRKKNIYFKYSEDEQFTGEYWIDGSKIYSKTFESSTLGSAELNINHGISDIGNYRTFDFGNSFWYNKLNFQCYPLNTYINSSSWSSSYSITDTQVQMRFGANFVSNWGMFITIKYTKKVN